jgi:hypothetical protein
VPLRDVVFARVGDKRANANLGVWARNDAAYNWLTAYLTAAEPARLLGAIGHVAVDAMNCRSCVVWPSCSPGTSRRADRQTSRSTN